MVAPDRRPKRWLDDLWYAPLGEGLLLLVVALLGWATGQPLIFASLGPTAYELVEEPRRPSARTYNIVVGHWVGVGAGFFALWVFHSAAVPAVDVAHGVPQLRIWTALLAVVLTALAVLLLRASHPAALATTLLVALGVLQTPRAGLAIVIGVVVVAAVGAPLRRGRIARLQARGQ